MTEHIDESDNVETHEQWATRKMRESMVVTNYQGKAALIQMELYDAAEQEADASDSDLIKLAWSTGSFVRLSPWIEVVRVKMGLTHEQVDDLFRVASKIN